MPTTRYELVTHPRWPLYKKLRREIARQLEADFRVSGIDNPVVDDDVDIYIQANLGSITRKLKELFRLDLKTRAKVPEKVAFQQDSTARAEQRRITRSA